MGNGAPTGIWPVGSVALLGGTLNTLRKHTALITVGIWGQGGCGRLVRLPDGSQATISKMDLDAFSFFPNTCAFTGGRIYE